MAPRQEVGVEVEEVKKLPDGGVWRWMEPAEKACRYGNLGWYGKVTI